MWHSDPRYVGDRWWPFFGGLIPLLLFLIVIGLVVWAVFRVTRAPGATAPLPPAPASRDRALDELRFRYARGEIDREEFQRRSADLGGGMHAGEGPPLQTG
jgi:putative membrane protein